MQEIDKTDQHKADQSAYELGKMNGKDFSGLTPRFIEELMKIKSDAPILEGIRQGYADYLKEQKDLEHSRLPDWLQPDRLTRVFNDKAPHPDRDKDKGNEPEK